MIEAMKKTYMMPAIKVVNIQIGNLLQQSQLQVVETVNNVSGDSRRAGGRESSDWEDEE